MILAPTPDAITAASDLLRRGGLVGMPSETVYGLAANAWDEKACANIFRVKNRPTNDPLIVHVIDSAQAQQIAHFDERAYLLAQAFWPGPLTLVLPKQDAVSNLITAGLPSVAVRSPAHEVFRSVLTVCNLPLAAPSANPFGYISPTTAQHVADQLGHSVEIILDGGPCSIGLESTIVDLRHPKHMHLLRPGVITEQEISSILAERALWQSAVDHSSGAQVAPGNLKSHYSPRKPLDITDGPISRELAEVSIKHLYICQTRPADWESLPTNVRWLSDFGEPSEIARNLFKILRTADHETWEHLTIERYCGDSPLGFAINDRIMRAAAKSA